MIQSAMQFADDHGMDEGTPDVLNIVREIIDWSMIQGGGTSMLECALVAEARMAGYVSLFTNLLYSTVTMFPFIFFKI